VCCVVTGGELATGGIGVSDMRALGDGGGSESGTTGFAFEAAASEAAAAAIRSARSSAALGGPLRGTSAALAGGSVLAVTPGSSRTEITGVTVSDGTPRMAATPRDTSLQAARSENGSSAACLARSWTGSRAAICSR
jgi:hypothetical protein